MCYQYLILPVKKYLKSLDMKAGINLCVKKIFYKILQKQISLVTMKHIPYCFAMKIMLPIT